VPFGADERPNDFDSAGLSDEEGAADDAHEFAAHEGLFLPGAESGDGFVIGIAEQWKIETVLLLEGGQGFDGVGAQAEDGNFAPVKLLFCVTKLGRLNGSTGSIGLGIKKEQDTLAFEVLEADASAVVGEEAECGGFFTWFEHGNALPRSLAERGAGRIYRGQANGFTIWDKRGYTAPFWVRPFEFPRLSLFEGPRLSVAIVSETFQSCRLSYT